MLSINDSLDTAKYKLNFFTVATGRYKIFVLPQIVSELYHNKQAIAEVLVEKTSFFTKAQRKYLDNYFPKRWIIRQLNDPIMRKWRHSQLLKSIRWLVIPKIKLPYTYISDVDILVLDKGIHHKHIEHAKFINRPYSNIVRPVAKNRHKITGLHFVLTTPYYQKVNQGYLNMLKRGINKLPQKALISYSEQLIYKMMKAKVGLPENIKDPRAIYRPVHGIHSSLNRRLLGWGITNAILEKYITFEKTDVWQEGLSVFGKTYVDVTKQFRRSNKLLLERNELRKKIWRGLSSKEEANARNRIAQLEKIKYKVIN